MTDNSAFTPQEVADILKISKNTVYELIKRGELNSSIIKASSVMLAVD